MRPRLNVVLVEPEIPPNTGNVGRLCHCIGARLHLVEPLGFSLGEKQLRRAGMDYWHELDLRRWTSLDEFLCALDGESRIWLFSTKAGRDYWDAEFSDGDFLVFGRETRGLPEGLLRARGESCLRIPMEDTGRSLNLATAVAIGAYEALRQIRISD